MTAREPWCGSFVIPVGKEQPLADGGERELIDALRRKDMAALEQLLERFGGAMATLARSMLRDATEACAPGCSVSPRTCAAIGSAGGASRRARWTGRRRSRTQDSSSTRSAAG